MRYEYKRESKHRKVEEQNRLYDLLQSATQTQIDRIAALTKEYRQAAVSAPQRNSRKKKAKQKFVFCRLRRRGFGADDWHGTAMQKLLSK